MEQKKSRKGLIIVLIVVLAVVALVAGGAAISAMHGGGQATLEDLDSSTRSSGSSGKGSDDLMSSEQYSINGAAESSDNYAENRDYEVYMHLESEQFDDAIQSISDIMAKHDAVLISRSVSEQGGYLYYNRSYSDADVHSRMFETTVEVPSDEFDATIAELEGTGKVLTENIRSSEIRKDEATGEEYSNIDVTKGYRQVDVTVTEIRTDVVRVTEDMSFGQKFVISWNQSWAHFGNAIIALMVLVPWIIVIAAIIAILVAVDHRRGRKKAVEISESDMSDDA